ncbi:MAG: DUF364 domain-containing protein [Polyangia bacterium]|jgi:uncharacterized protein (DUF4213/DUF364 family)|nr:DUF364 domain-containing protein [Polyangia bacterium]
MTNPLLGDPSALFDALLESAGDDAEVTTLAVGAFTIGCQSRRLGLASLARPATPEHSHEPVRRPGQLTPSSAKALASRLFAGSVLERSIAIAALNSLLSPPEDRLLELNAAQLIARRSAGRRVAVVGHFPFVETLRQSASRVDVFELPEGWREGDLEASRLPELLPEADVLAISGTTLANGTLGEILGQVSPSAYVVLVGGSTPLCPLLFDLGIDALSGALVASPELALAALSQGGTFRQLPGVRRVTLLCSMP